MMIRGFEENMKEFNKQMDIFNKWMKPDEPTTDIKNVKTVTTTEGTNPPATTTSNNKFIVTIPYTTQKKRVYRAESYTLPNYKKVIFNNPYTIVLWEDGTKTTVKVTDGDTFSEEAGFALCMLKKMTKDSFKGIFKDVIKNASRPDYSKKKDKKD